MTFETYLQEVHAKGYHGTDDAMSDSFETWLEVLEKADLMELAECFALEMSNQVLKSVNLAEKEIAGLKEIKEN